MFKRKITNKLFGNYYFNRSKTITIYDLRTKDMQVKTQLDELQNYLIDASNLQGGHADKLFIPETAEQIAEILKEANENKIPVTISGARTGTVGGAIPYGGYVISLEKFNQIKEINENYAIVESGVILNDLQKAVEAQNLFYPPDPTEWSCQIGGTVATNASGARSFKYGATREFVEKLQIVLANGEILNLKRGEIFAKNGIIELENRNRKYYRSKNSDLSSAGIAQKHFGLFFGGKFRRD